jgi:hypothetical protein
MVKNGPLDVDPAAKQDLFFNIMDPFSKSEKKFKKREKTCMIVTFKKI